MGERLLLSDVVRDLLRRLVAQVGHGSRLLGVANACEQVSNLVRVHAWGRHLDWASPVEVIVAQVERELFKLELGQRRLVQGHEEVSRTHAALSSLHGHQEEVELTVSALSRRALNQVSIDDAATRRVVETVVVVNDEEGLDDPLVDDQESDLWAS